jgi:hypothetical protein
VLPPASVPPAVTAQAPARQLSLSEHAVVQAWAARAPRLTPERADELAALASSAWGGRPDDAAPSQRLHAVAAWLWGGAAATAPSSTASAAASPAAAAADRAAVPTAPGMPTA